MPGRTVKYATAIVKREGGGAQTYEKLCADLKAWFLLESRCELSQPTEKVRLVGLLFMRPSTAFAASEILPSISYYHRRSGQHFNFYCAGFEPSWNPADSSVPAESHYSDWSFESFRVDIATKSKWCYSGGCDLLLTNARFDGYRAALDFSSAICADLMKMKADRVIDSVDAFFERIFRYAEDQDDRDPTWGFSDQMGGAVAGAAFKNLLISLLPKGLQEDAKRAFHFAVRDVSR